MAFMFAFSSLGMLGETLSFFPSGLISGGPVVFVWSWLVQIFFSFCIGEMCAAYPCVGSVYYWSYAYSPSAESGRVFSYVCGLFYFFGCITYDASVAYGVAEYISACNNIMSTTGTEYPVYTLVIISLVIVGMWGAKNLLTLQN